MCSSNSDKFYYYYYFSCSYDQLCWKSILFFSRWCAGSDTNRHSGWNLFIHCRINDQCGNRSDYSELKHCGNLYGYIYNGCGGRMCCPDSDYFSYHNNITDSNIQLYRNTILSLNAANPSPTFSGGGVAGTFSSTAGLVFVSTATGQINLSASTPGTYTVTNTMAASGGCAAETATSSITITALPAATISYAGSPFCSSLVGAQAVTQTGTAGGTYSSTAGLTINAATGAITPSSSTAGTYTVTYTMAAAGGCAAQTATTSVTITALPVATFSYTGTPYCQNAANPSPTFSGGGVAGTFSSTAGLVFVSTATGQINLSASTPGTYTVTNTIAASSGCAAVTATSSITITTLPAATISYAGSPFCSSLVGAQAVTQTGTAGGTYSSTAGLTINAATGAITPSSSTAGTYTVTYTMAAAGGCAAQTATTSITITTLPVATISYTGTPYCQNAAKPSL